MITPKEATEERLLKLKKRVDLAAGRERVDMVLTNAQVVNVFNGHITTTNIAIADGKIIGLGDYEGYETIDMQHKYVIPGLIDAHMHMESTLVTPDQMARIIVPRGTTTVIADPHEIANVCGMDGVKYMMAYAANTPLNGFFMLPSCVPATPFENAGAVLTGDVLEELIDHTQVLGLGELMNYPGVIEGQLDVMDKMNRFHYKIIDGHGPELTGKALNAYAINGIRTEHECTSLREMEERLSIGMYIAIREGSAARNLEKLIQGVNDHTKHMCMFCTDDKHPEDILAQGHIDYNIRKAISLGLDPITAIQMATINPARCYELRDIGAIAPGYDADLVVIDDLRAFNVHEVYKKGICVARHNIPHFDASPLASNLVIHTVKVEPVEAKQFKLPLQSDIANVIRIIPDSILTEKVVRRIYQDKEGCFITNERLDVVKIAVIERHGKTRNIGIGLVENFGHIKGAIATTIAHDSHNIIVIGDTDEDMALAVNRLIDIQGGIVLASKGDLLGELALPIAGLMTPRPMEEVCDILKALKEMAHDVIGIKDTIEPFMTLSFLALPVIPELKITDKGYFDVKAFQHINTEA